MALSQPMAHGAFTLKRYVAPRTGRTTPIPFHKRVNEVPVVNAVQKRPSRQAATCGGFIPLGQYLVISPDGLEFFPAYVRKRTERPAANADSPDCDIPGQNPDVMRSSLRPQQFDPYGCFSASIDQEKHMIRFGSFPRPLTWISAILLAAFLAGCGGGGGDGVATAPGPGPAAGPAPVNLGAAGTFAILSRSGITDVPTSAITGDVGTSPITGAAIHVTCPEVTGTIYATNAAGPLPCAVTDATLLTAATDDMVTAYLDAEGRTSPDSTELGAGEIGGLTLVPGLYKWSTGVSISTDVTLSGDSNDVWIFQIAGDLTQANATSVHLSGGALPKNIFWQTFGVASLGTTAHFEGVILSQTSVTLGTLASVNGRLFAGTAVALDQNAVTQPAP